MATGDYLNVVCFCLGIIVGFSLYPVTITWVEIVPKMMQEIKSLENREESDESLDINQVLQQERAFNDLLNYILHPSNACPNPLVIRSKKDKDDIDGDNIICLPPGKRIQKNCLVYTFGIMDKLELHESLERDFGCQIFGFEVSLSEHSVRSNPKLYNLAVSYTNTMTGKKEDRWTLKTFEAIRKELEHEHSSIEILLMDTDGDEWNVLEQLLNSQILQVVHHLCIVVHLIHPAWEKMLQLLQRIETEAGFHLFSSKNKTTFSSQTVLGLPNKKENAVFELSWYRKITEI